jgi:tetratricopeptide (TPR) repeat protein
MLTRGCHRIGCLLMITLIAAGCSTMTPPLQPVRAPKDAESPVDRSAVIMAIGAPKVIEQAQIRAHAHFAAGVVDELNGRSEDSLREFSLAAENDPGDEWLTLEVSRRMIGARKWEDAARILTRATTEGKMPGSVYALLGTVYSQMGRSEEAVAANRLAIKKSPGTLAGYQNLFLGFVQQKEAERALGILEEASRQPKPDLEYLVGLSDLYLTLGVQFPTNKTLTQARALSVLQRAEKIASENPSLQLKLADGLNMLGDREAAARQYLGVLKALPDVPLLREQLHAKLADIYLRGGDRKAAVTQLEAIVKADPLNSQAYFFLGELAYEGTNYAGAADYLKQAVLLAPDFEPAYASLATAQLASRNAGEALRTLEKARDKFGKSFRTEMLAGMAASMQKDYTNAVQFFTAAEVIARASEPRRLNHVFYYQAAGAHERRGDFLQAELYLKKALDLAPDYSPALNFLGYMWADRGQKLEEAKEMIEKALKEEPKNGAYLDSMAWVLFRQSQPKPALDLLLQAIELIEEPDPTLYDHLGDVYSALGQKEKAREAWSKSLSLEPSEKTKQKLNEGRAP